MQHDILFIRLGTGLPQWLKVCLLLQETRVQSLVQEDSICHRQLSPCATNTEACCALEPVLRNQRSPHTTIRQWPLLALTRESPCTAPKT